MCRCTVSWLLYTGLGEFALVAAKEHIRQSLDRDLGTRPADPQLLMFGCASCLRMLATGVILPRDRNRKGCLTPVKCYELTHLSYASKVRLSRN
jgi:hypothetical protein